MNYTEWTPELTTALCAPFPKEDHKTKRQGGTEITFIDVHKYKERLNATVGPQGWSCMVRLEAFGGKLVCTVALEILGVVKENVGDEVEVPALNDKGNEKIIGAPVTNSYAQAFKRACSDFGLGAYLYDEAKRNAATKGNGANRGDTERAPAARPAGKAASPADVPMPFGPTKGKPLGEHNQTQLRKTMDWCREKDAEKFADLIGNIEHVLANPVAL